MLLPFRGSIFPMIIQCWFRRPCAVLHTANDFVSRCKIQRWLFCVVSSSLEQKKCSTRCTWKYGSTELFHANLQKCAFIEIHEVKKFKENCLVWLLEMLLVAFTYFSTYWNPKLREGLYSLLVHLLILESVASQFPVVPSQKVVGGSAHSTLAWCGRHRIWSNQCWTYCMSLYYHVYLFN